VGDEGNIEPLAFHFGHAERDGVGAIGNFAEVAIEKGVLHEADGVVVTDGGDHEALGIISGGGTDDLETGGVRQEILGRVGVGRADIRAAVGRAADNHRDIDESARHVADAAGIVDDLIKADIGEAPEHELDHRPQTHHGRTDAEAQEGRLADRGVDDPLGAEALPEPLGDFVGAVVLGDLLTHQKDVLVAGEFLGKSVVESLAVGDERHG